MHSPRVDHVKLRFDDGRSDADVVLARRRQRGGGAAAAYVGGSPLFNRDRNPPPPPHCLLCRTLSRIFIFSSPQHFISRPYVSRSVSEHQHALRGITRRTRVVVIYAACTLACTYVRYTSARKSESRERLHYMWLSV